MKIAIITDTHFGARNDSQIFSDYIREFYETIFFPYLINNNINKIIHLGDVFDRRKYINFKTLQDFNEMFMYPLYKHKIDLTVLTGNHDVFYKNTNELNSLNLLLREGLHQSLDIMDITHTRKFHNDFVANRHDFTKILLVPWINEENYQHTMEQINKFDGDIVLGHLELVGFSMHKGMNNQEGMNSNIFDKFDIVCSGHFHHKSSKKNIHYLGCPYQITWADYDDPKGFHILDTDTKELEFIENPLQLFHKIIYNDENEYHKCGCIKIQKSDKHFNYNIFENKYIKLFVEKKTDNLMFDNFVDNIYKINPANLIILDNLDDYSIRYSEDDDMEIEDTAKFISGYIDDMIEFNSVQKTELDIRLKKTYIQALNIDE